jgi:hypothetical protein
MKPLALLVLLALPSIPIFANKDKPAYEVGTFVENRRVSDGTFSSASCGSFGCSGSAYNASHNVHFVITPEGHYAIEAPVSVAGTILVGMLNNGYAPTMHKEWFMDNLHEGDTVLFSPQCNKHNRCTIRLPNPDNPNKEITTFGEFDPNSAKTNARVLCGTGRLTVAVEAQMCSAQPNVTQVQAQPNVAQVPAQPVVTPTPVVLVPVVSVTPPIPATANNSAMQSIDLPPESLGNYARRMKAEKAAQH